ncbi:MAG: 16S rRNA (cytosine(967)-C(5))-methyltransferase RsmB [Betaproteobacteria bacterium]|nr:16S rRNA (cytosine(967)-C(5))-methyltransferase RsmB [Betaproteobacteria bacterium]
MLATQLTASRVLTQVLNGRNLNEALDAALAADPGLTPQQRGAIREACFDTLRHYGLIEAELRALVKMPPREEIDSLLKIALAQLQFGRAKPYAIVDHAVKATHALGQPQARGLVNAVLRNFQRKQDNLPDEVRAINRSAQHNLPLWWIHRIQQEYPEHWEGLAASAMLHPPLTLRANIRKTTMASATAKLEAAGFTVTALGREALRIDPPRPVNDIPGFAEGEVSVQDAGAQYAAHFLDAADGMRVLDACAAPGGKTGHLLEQNSLELTALDNDAKRVSRIESNLARLGLAANIRTADAAQPDTWWDGRPFDRILLDAPCSGSGVIRRHPDIKWLRRESDLSGFATQQSALLSSLWKCLARGGRLLYVTCTVFRQENEGVVEAFMNAQAESGNGNKSEGVARLPLPHIETTAFTPHFQDGQLLPDAHHDGFFFALLAKP